MPAAFGKDGSLAADLRALRCDGGCCCNRRDCRDCCRRWGWPWYDGPYYLGRDRAVSDVALFGGGLLLGAAL